MIHAEVREAFKRTLLPGFRAYIIEYIAKKSHPGALPGDLRPCGELARLASPVAVLATDAGPLINALVHALKNYVRMEVSRQNKSNKLA